MAEVRRRSSSLTSTSSSRSWPLSERDDNEDRKRILVITGGSGALGSTIAKIAHSHWEGLQEIRLFDCVPPNQDVITSITGFSSPPNKPKVSYHHGNLLDEDSLMSCFAKADIVIHSAAVVENGVSIIARRHMKKVNIDGTQKVIQACLDCGVQALVFTGSVSQVLGTNTQKPVRYDESYHMDSKSKLIYPHYGGSKNKAENLVLLADSREGDKGVKLRTCSLRFPVMYGEGDKVFIPSAIQAAKRCCGYFIPMGLTGASGVTMQSIYYGNAAWAHILAAKKLLNLGTNFINGDSIQDPMKTNGIQDPRSDPLDTASSELDVDIGGKFYYIGDHSPICTVTNFHAQFLQPMGYRISPIGLPFCLGRILAFFLEFLLILLAFVNVDIPVPLTRATFHFLKLSHSLSWEKAKREIGYTPLYSHKTTLARSMEFYRKTV